MKFINTHKDTSYSDKGYSIFPTILVLVGKESSSLVFGWICFFIEFDLKTKTKK